MKGKRTGPNATAVIKNFFTFIGKPVLHVLLLITIAFAVIFTSLLKIVIQFIKINYYVLLKTSTLFKIFTLTALHSLLLTFKKHRLKLQTPIRYLTKLPSLKVPIISIKRKKTVLILLFIISVGSLCITGIFFITKDLPNPEKLKTREQIVSTKIFSRNTELLYTIYKNENRSIIKLQDLPPYLINATISIEDKDFYKHPGYSYKGILRAIRQIIFEQKIQGGSTITQQLVKNALLNQEKTVLRKIKEIILAIITETKFTKDEILTMYFNEVGYGGSSYGVQEASMMYFGKPANKLTLAEAALLAGLPAAPTHYSPFGAHPELAKFRQHEVLRRMVEDQYLTAEEAETAKAEKLVFAAQKTDIKAPHFVMYVKDLLVKKFGERVVEQGGLEVITSLDLDIQNLAQQKVTQEVNKLSKLNITNAAALVTKPETGEILAMVGSKDFFDFEHDGQVNVTLSPRQPGSSIKPINYAVALENGFTAATVIDDSPITYHVPGQPPYSPENYDGNFHGRVTLREALANSYNVPAVKTLSVFGVDKMIEKGRQMGITTWEDKQRFGLSLTLGGGEVKMTDMAVSYGVLANFGKRVDLNPILKVTNYKGEVLYQYICEPYIPQADINKTKTQETCTATQVLKPEIAFILTNILSDNEARSRAFGRYSVLTIPRNQVAVKTGTTQNLRDNWTIGYTQDFLVATWVGNNDNTPMSFVASGITGASPIWNEIMTTILADKAEHRFPIPQTLVIKQICPLLGTLPCQGCPGKPEYFITGTEPKKACIPIKSADQESTEPNQNSVTPDQKPQDSITPQTNLDQRILEGWQTHQQ